MKKIVKEAIKNGKVYSVNETKKTVKQIRTFNSLKELADDKIVDEANKVSMGTYIAMLRNDGFEVSVKNGYFVVKGYKVTFDGGIKVVDTFNYAEEVLFEEPPMPKKLIEFLSKEKEVRVFSPRESTEAAIKGKRIMEERKEVKAAAIAEAKVDNDLELQKAKALRLLNRIEKKQSDPKKLFEEIPSMINFHRVKVNISLQIKNYNKGFFRFPKLLRFVKNIIEKEDFSPTPKKAAKFTGTDPIKFKVLKDEKGFVVVDGIKINKGKFLVKYLLDSTKNYVKAMPQIMRYLKGEIKKEVLWANPYEKNLFIGYDEKLLDKISSEQAEALETLYYKVGLFNPLRFNYVPGLKKGDKVEMFEDIYAECYTGVVVSVTSGTWVRWSDGEVTPIFIQTRFTKI